MLSALENLNLNMPAISSAYSAPGIGGNLTFNNGGAGGGLPNAGPGTLNAGVYASAGGMTGYAVAGVAALFILLLVKKARK